MCRPAKALARLRCSADEPSPIHSSAQVSPVRKGVSHCCSADSGALQLTYYAAYSKVRSVELRQSQTLDLALGKFRYSQALVNQGAQQSTVNSLIPRGTLRSAGAHVIPVQCAAQTPYVLRGLGLSGMPSAQRSTVRPESMRTWDYGQRGPQVAVAAPPAPVQRPAALS